MNDIVIQMLRFGKTRIINGFTQQELIDHLANIGFQLEQVNNTVSLYFSNYFTFPGGGYHDTTTTPYYLKPNGYFDLLQIENTLESRRQSKNANFIATISIIISGLLALGAILTTIFYTPDIKLNDNKQLKEIIDNEVQNKVIFQQTQQDIISIKDTLNNQIVTANAKKQK